MDQARRGGFGRLSLETGSQGNFTPARASCTEAGFVVCGRFGDYPDSTNSVFMTRRLADV